MSGYFDYNHKPHRFKSGGKIPFPEDRPANPNEEPVNLDDSRPPKIPASIAQIKTIRDIIENLGEPSLFSLLVDIFQEGNPVFDIKGVEGLEHWQAHKIIKHCRKVDKALVKNKESRRDNFNPITKRQEAAIKYYLNHTGENFIDMKMKFFPSDSPAAEVMFVNSLSRLEAEALIHGYILGTRHKNIAKGVLHILNDRGIFEEYAPNDDRPPPSDPISMDEEEDDFISIF